MVCIPIKVHAMVVSLCRLLLTQIWHGNGSFHRRVNGVDYCLPIFGMRNGSFMKELMAWITTELVHSSYSGTCNGNV